MFLLNHSNLYLLISCKINSILRYYIIRFLNEGWSPEWDCGKISKSESGFLRLVVLLLLGSVGLRVFK